MRVKIRIGMFMTLCAMLLLVGCVPALEPLAWVKERLQDKLESQETLVFQPNPMYEYPITVTEELLTVLDMDAWEDSAPNYGETIAMVYCDISDDQRAYRLAVFSNGDILLQEYKDGLLRNGEQHWYHCATKPNGQLFEDLLDLIDGSTS